MAGRDSQRSPASEPLLLGREVSPMVVVVGGISSAHSPISLQCDMPIIIEAVAHG